MQIVGKPEYAPPAVSASYRPIRGAPDEPEASSSSDSDLTLSSQTLLSFYQNPSSYTTSDSVLRRIPHKIDGQLTFSGYPCFGYGLELEEGILTPRVGLLRLILVVLSITFDLAWSCVTGQISSGFAICAALSTLAIYLVELCKEQEY